ncbi:MAG: PAS domain-containing protein [Actinomycetota bacterium]|nr:PAS domain-containing protein [Actinomycetota bacterium]
MVRAEHKSLALILTRDLASNLATPLFIVDPEGTLVFYNEPAEAVLGKRYAEAGELSADDWSGAMFDPQDETGRTMRPREMPLGIALSEHRPAHGRMSITGLDGLRRTIEVTAFPLFARSNEVAGAVAIFWEDRGDAPE